MNKYKKILSWFLLSSIIFSNFAFVSANDEYTSVTKEEKQKVETEVLKLQSKLFDNSKNLIEKLSADFEKLTSYEESGNSKIEISVDEDTFWKATATLNLEDYIIKNKKIDSDISGKISLKADYKPVYWTWFEMDLSTFMSFIQKDSEMYALLKDLDFKVTDENVQKVLEELKNQFSDNKYLKLPSDENSKIAFEYIKNFNVNNFYTQTKEVLSKPLLTPYKKSWEKIILVPSKYSCDIFFELENKFNATKSWYEPKSCTETVYKTLVSDFVTSGELYIIFSGGENTFWYNWLIDDSKIKSSLKYNDESITRFDFYVIPDQSKYKNEWLSLNFKSKEYIKFKFNADKWDMIFDFDSKIDENNNFIYITSILKSPDFNWNLSLKDNKINGFYIIKQKWYDYNSDDWEYKLKNVYGIKITWITNSANSLQKLNLQMAWVDFIDKKALFVLKSSYENGNFIVNLSSKDEYSPFELNATWYIDEKYFSFASKFNAMEIYSWKLDMIIDTKDDKNNAKVDFVLNNSKKDIVKMLLTNDAKRTYKNDINIEVPSDFNEISTEELTDLLFENQMKISRDSTRYYDLLSMQSSLEQYYADNTKYPSLEDLKSSLEDHIYTFPKEVKEYEVIDNCDFWYMYGVSSDFKKYILATCVETQESKQKAKEDGWLYDKYLESWNWIGDENIELNYIEE